MKAKFLAYMMVLVMLVSLCACQQQTGMQTTSTQAGSNTVPPAATQAPGDTQTPAGGNLTEPATFPIVKQTITLRIMTPDPGGNNLDLSDNAFTQWYEEKSNIRIDWEIIASGGTTENVNLALSSGNLPDVFLNCGISTAMQALYGPQGSFVALNEYIDRSMYYQQAAQTYPAFYATNVMPDGHIYSIPNFSDTYHMTWPYKMWVYEPFLTALGLEEPATTEEFRDMLIAFKHDDPNGNGQEDEIPFSSLFINGVSSMEGFIMSAFICDVANPSSPGYRMLLDGGQIITIYSQPQWKQGLLYFAQLYEDGLLDPQCFTQNTDQLKALGENEVPILGASMGNYAGSFTQWGSESGRCYDYIAISPIEGPEGVRVAPTNPWKGGSGRYVVTSACAEPEAAFRWGEGFYVEEIMMRAIYGVPEQDWFIPGAYEVGINGLPAKWKGGVEQDQDQNSAWLLITPYYRTADFRLSQSAENPETNLEVILYNATLEKYAPYAQSDDTIAPSIILEGELNEEAANLSQTIMSYVNEFFTQSVMGAVDIEQEWDNYLAQLEAMGLSRLTELYQQGYEKQYQ